MFFCAHVLVGFSHKSLDSNVTLSLCFNHLYNWCVWSATTAKLYLLSYLRMCLLRCMIGPLSDVSCIEWHQLFFEVV